jgi:SAM-dependent methyltransferase
MDALEAYLRDLCEIRSSGAGVKETSYYAALSNLFNEVGKSLKPKVRCILQLANRGAGLPDGGLFTPDQYQKTGTAEPLLGQIPSRGVIEVKGTSDDAWVTADGLQVSKYWGKYHQVLVTNLRDFVLVGQDSEGKPAKLEIYRLANNEPAFWAAAAHPRKTAAAEGERFIEYLKRVMLHAAPLAAPQDVAWFLASYAREAKARVEAADLPALTSLRAALEDALGLRFEAEKGEHFFRSTLVQTLFYGIFSAWVLWSKQHPPSSDASFNWREAAWYLRVPMIRALFEQVATPTKLGPLGLVEVLDWTGAALNRVDRISFFAEFEEGHAVQYFYEPFLKAFDPDLRKELGVWYTPPEIVRYMVARVDTVLRQELDLPDGLAEPNVYVLDPCCGTGTYLVEVLHRIGETFKAKGGDALAAHDVKRAAMERVFGFEILPAPFVVAHLQLGLLLQNLGVPLAEANNERPGVYLTNALTGWEPLDKEKEKAFQAMLTGFPELREERDHAQDVKQKVPILVILGNPPYNAFAGTSPEEEQGLVEPYKEGLISKWGIKKFNLDDLYVRFFRLAERRIAEQTGRGIVAFISNFSYLGGPSFTVIRERFLNGFDKLWFDCMNGDSRETGKLTPDGKPDPSVFSTEYNREGIRVGTTIAVMVRKPHRSTQPTVRFRQFWGATKRADLLESLKAKDFDAQFELVNPGKTNRFSFRPAKVADHYLQWPTLVELSSEPPINGLMEKRGGRLFDIRKADLEQRMRMYYDAQLDWETLQALGTGLTEDAAGFSAKAVRMKVLAVEQYQPARVRRYALRPFDTRWCYYTDVSPVWNRCRPSLWAQCWEGNAFLMSRPAGVALPEGVPFFFTRLLGDNDFLRGHAYYIPMRLRPAAPKVFDALPEPQSTPTANLSPLAREYLTKIGIDDSGADADIAELVWMHALAIGYSPAYLTENADGIRQDWPRVPLPGSRERFLASAQLGRQVAALLDTEGTIPSVTAGTIRPELTTIAVISRVSGGPLDPQGGDLALTAGWGHAGKGGVTMPGTGRLVEREYTPMERAAIEDGAKALGLSLEEALLRLGTTTFDIYLNELAFWANVPVKVWGYTIGGYQVVKKWLSYRERDLLGRDLTPDEVREVRDIARRMAALVLLETQLDANYHAVKAEAYEWGGKETAC